MRVLEGLVKGFRLGVSIGVLHGLRIWGILGGGLVIQIFQAAIDCSNVAPEDS